MQLAGRAHAADGRDAGLGRPLQNFQLGAHGVHRVHNVIVQRARRPGKGQLRRRAGGVKQPHRHHPAGRADVRNAGGGRLGFGQAHRAAQRDQLPVQVALAHPVVVH